MKKIFATGLFISAAFFATAQTAISKNHSDSVVFLKTRIVEASCGECKFALKGHGCDLAVRINGKSYFVDGAKPISAYGDQSNPEAMCEAVHKAEVTGEIKNDRFVATSFKVFPLEKKN